MKKISPILWLAIIVTTCFSCTPNSQQAEDGAVYRAALRKDGTAFYAYDQKSKKINYMLDYGEQKGTWQSFGPAMTLHGDLGLQFDVIERAGAASFYVMHPHTGQLYYTVDGANASDSWQAYGNLISASGKAKLRLEAEGRFEGNSFYALDTGTGQMYYMNDFGDQAGEWLSYGDKL